MNTRRALLAAFALSATFATALPAAAEALDDIMKAKVIRIAVPQDFPPFGSVGTDMQPLGYDIDMANLIGKELGVKVELVPVSSANRIPYLQTKKVDLVISSLGKNPEREKVIDFSSAYAPFFQGVFGLKDIKLSKPEELAGKTVGMTRGALEDLELTKLAPPTATLKRFEDNNANIAAFLSGQVDLIATGNVVAATIAEKNPQRAPVVKFVIKASPCFVGMNKGEPKLMAKVNEIIAKARSGGALEKVSMKWLKAGLPSDL